MTVRGWAIARRFAQNAYNSRIGHFTVGISRPCSLPIDSQKWPILCRVGR